MIKDKSVVLGVCGGIAAYKVVEVASRLKKLDAIVDVIMTENATEFVTPLTFRSITHRPVVTDMFAEPKTFDVQHISLATKADIIVIAPATANIIGKLASGIADDMLTTTVMASTSPVLIAPAMNFNMYQNPIVQQNIEKLKSLGYIFMEPETGRMAEGSSGKGRLPEPVRIVEDIIKILSETDTVNRDVSLDNTIKDFTGLKVLITAGPTREPIDPVRYITNRSSGKMGYAIAEAASKRGAEVVLVSGPVAISKPENVVIKDVNTADEMYKAVMEEYESSHVVIAAAAVADYKCAEIADRKIKKQNHKMIIELQKNVDILKELGKNKGSHFLVGFSAETNDLIENAKSKIESKNLDLIVANDVTIKGAGFESDTNIVKLIRKDGSIKNLPIMQKTDVANKILDEIIEIYPFK